MIHFIVVMLAIFACAKLWRMGGDGAAWARRVGVPAVIALTKFHLVGYWTHPMNWLVLLYMPVLWLLLSLFSYGRSAPPHRFWSWALQVPNDEEFLAVEIVTRATCGFFWSLATVVFVCVTGNLPTHITYILFLTVVNGVVGGMVSDANISERVIGASTACALLV